MTVFFVLAYFLLPGLALGKDYFTAAVFEHRPRTDNASLGSPMDIISSNLKIIEKAIPIAAEKKADIIVFNEYAIYTHVKDRYRLKEFAEHIPDPTRFKINPCMNKKNNTFLLSKFSCYAKEHNIYIVINVLDIQTCSDTCDADRIDECSTDCPKDGNRIFNTNVAFDREGYIVARYHKAHTYFEHVETPTKPDFITFKTDFGTFGLQICFDAVFEESMTLARDHGIDTLIFPTFWYDDILPFNGIEFQQAWALANGVNFMAANTHRPGSASIGSGIYSKDTGALVYTYEPDGESKLLMANLRTKDDKEIPSLSSLTVISEDGISQKQTEEGIHFPEHCHVNKTGTYKNRYSDYRCYKSHIERHSKRKLQGPSGTLKSCYGNFCCYLKYSAQSMDEDFYLTAYSGLNDVKNYFYFKEETCLLIRCDPFEGKPCILHTSTSKTIFKEIDISAQLSAQTIYATVSMNRFRLAPKKDWSYSTDASITKLSYRMNSSVPLLKAGLFGRNYDEDPPYVPLRYHQYY